MTALNWSGISNQSVVGDTLRRARPIVFVALHSHNQKQLCAELLHAANYDLYDMAGIPIAGVPAADEIYATPAW